VPPAPAQRHAAPGPGCLGVPHTHSHLVTYIHYTCSSAKHAHHLPAPAQCWPAQLFNPRTRAPPSEAMPHCACRAVPDHACCAVLCRAVLCRGYYADIPFVSESVYHQVQLSEYA